MNTARLIHRMPARQIKSRHLIGAGVLIAIWVMNLFVSNCFDYDLSKLLFHPIKDFDLFIFFPIFSIWAAWNLRDGRKDNELTLQLLSVNYTLFVTTDSKSNTHQQTSSEQYLNNVHEFMVEIDKHSRSDSSMYVLSLLLGAYSTLCIAKAAIEKLGT